MTKGIVATMANPSLIPVAPRVERWLAPTGRWLERGNLFRLGDEGWFKFLAYVDSPTEPHVEAVAVTRTGERTVGGVRALRPERISRTSKKVAR